MGCKTISERSGKHEFPPHVDEGQQGYHRKPGSKEGQEYPVPDLKETAPIDDGDLFDFCRNLSKTGPHDQHRQGEVDCGVWQDKPQMRVDEIQPVLHQVDGDQVNGQRHGDHHQAEEEQGPSPREIEGSKCIAAGSAQDEHQENSGYGHCHGIGKIVAKMPRTPEDAGVVLQEKASRE